MGAPSIVEKLAASVSGVPMKWREEDAYWVIIMTDGRKYRFPKIDQDLPRHEETMENYKPAQEQVPQPEHRKKKRAD